MKRGIVIVGLEVACGGVELDAPAWVSAEFELDTMALSLRCYDELSGPIVVLAALLQDLVVSIETVLKPQRKPPFYRFTLKSSYSDRSHSVASCRIARIDCCSWLSGGSPCLAAASMLTPILMIKVRE